MINCKNKGCRGEREWAAFLRDMGIDARRGRQYCGDSEAPDVKTAIQGVHCEVKRTERLRIHPAMEQAEGDCGIGDVPYVAYKRNRAPWMVILRGFDVTAFCISWLTALGYRVDPPASARLSGGAFSSRVKNAS
jgi:Holliday junction resolvase